MTTVRTQINCPNCRQPITADIQQVFDSGVDPSAKSRLLSGQFNIAQCPQCGFHGNISTPMVYHDPEKELLMTFVPTELALPRNEQEKLIGDMINKVVDSLPPEKRKGYLFSPQTALTLQGLVERILNEDGITKEMIDAQQERVNLIQRLAGISDDEALGAVVTDEEKNIDAEFFAILGQLIQVSAAQGDQGQAQQLNDLQQKLLPMTAYGREIQAQSAEVEEAIKTLNEAGEELTREKLLELVVSAPNDSRVEAYVSLARPGMDYQFFQLLSGQIEAAENDEKDRLTAIREKLLTLTKEIDEQVAARLQVGRENVNRLVQVENIRETTLANLGAIDEFFLQALEVEMAAANESGDTEKLGKLQQIVETVQEVSKSSAGPDPEFLQQLIDADPDARKGLMEERAEEINEKFIETLTGLLVQLDSGENKDLAEKVRGVYRDAVRFSMQASMKAQTAK